MSILIMRKLLLRSKMTWLRLEMAEPGFEPRESGSSAHALSCYMFSASVDAPRTLWGCVQTHIAAD